MNEPPLGLFLIIHELLFSDLLSTDKPDHFISRCLVVTTWRKSKLLMHVWGQNGCRAGLYLNCSYPPQQETASPICDINTDLQRPEVAPGPAPPQIRVTAACAVMTLPEGGLMLLAGPLEGAPAVLHTLLRTYLASFITSFSGILRDNEHIRDYKVK